MPLSVHVALIFNTNIKSYFRVLKTPRNTFLALGCFYCSVVSAYREFGVGAVQCVCVCVCPDHHLCGDTVIEPFIKILNNIYYLFTF